MKDCSLNNFRICTNFIRLIIFGFALSGLVLSGTVLASDSECEEYIFYTVQDGDDFEIIALHFGDLRFKDALIHANIDLIYNLYLLVPGQSIRIPINIAIFKESGLTVSEVLKNPACRQADDEMLNEFRDAFQALVDAQSDTVEAGENYVKAEHQLLLEIDGMVVDETRSKVGRDFYDVFYQNWQAPPDARRFTITIFEQPAPGLGTIIYVKANETETFRYRLQPRYDFIMEAGIYAVRMTYQHLEQNPQDFIIY